mmetsp:Transcript_22400/g.43580  ORF Transcript_22400/g.43580 Transcript_22400/m.43580 type:complete len:203 (+) Transcript_22400:382-990(+)
MSLVHVHLHITPLVSYIRHHLPQMIIQGGLSYVDKVLYKLQMPQVNVRDCAVKSGVSFVIPKANVHPSLLHEVLDDVEPIILRSVDQRRFGMRICFGFFDQVLDCLCDAEVGGSCESVEPESVCCRYFRLGLFDEIFHHIRVKGPTDAIYKSIGSVVVLGLLGICTTSDGILDVRKVAFRCCLQQYPIDFFIRVRDLLEGFH